MTSELASRGSLFVNMSKGVVRSIGVFVGLHGIAHLVGTSGAFQAADKGEIEEYLGGFWEISDPGNAGTIIRTAAAFGFQVLATAGSVDLWAPKVIRSAVGGHFRTPVIENVAADLAEFDRVGLVPLATASDGVDIGKVDLSDALPVAFIVGNEAHGLPDTLTSRATTIALSMPGG